MPSGREGLDAHSKPPESLRQVFKSYQRAARHSLDDDEELVDLSNPDEPVRTSSLTRLHVVPEETFTAVHSEFLGEEFTANLPLPTCFEHREIKGLLIIPQMLPPEVQLLLLDRLLHRDLIDARHKTNVHLHYDVQYPANGQSFFTSPPTSDHAFHGLESGHAPLTHRSFLEKKLRWITLGGQYDWTAKRYPATAPPPFPPDIARLLHGLFPDMRAEAAIVNVYSPGDTLSLHRDVSEECDRPLVSVSLGCDAVFIAAVKNEAEGLKHVAVRLRSGDVVCMGGTARYAWHGVPQIVAGTCPDWLKAWPAPEYEAWRGWMANKRINLNVRQMYV